MMFLVINSIMMLIITAAVCQIASHTDEIKEDVNDILKVKNAK